MLLLFFSQQQDPDAPDVEYEPAPEDRTFVVEANARTFFVPAED